MEVSPLTQGETPDNPILTGIVRALNHFCLNHGDQLQDDFGWEHGPLLLRVELCFRQWILCVGASWEATAWHVILE